MRRSLIALGIGFGIVVLGPSCTTMYDAQGRPQQVITPEGAALAAVAAGVAGYAIANNNRRGSGYYDSCRPRRGHCR